MAACEVGDCERTCQSNLICKVPLSYGEGFFFFFLFVVVVVVSIQNVKFVSVQPKERTASLEF